MATKKKTKSPKVDKFAITSAEAAQSRKHKLKMKNAKKRAKYHTASSSIDGLHAVRVATLQAIEESQFDDDSLDDDDTKDKIVPSSPTPVNYYDTQQSIPTNELKRAFDAFDRDGNGSIDAKELTEVLKTVGRSVDPEKLEQIMKEIDKDGNGMVDFEEFEYVVQVKMEDNLHDEESMRELFDFFDVNGDNHITEVELLRVMNKTLKCKLSRDDIHDMVRFADQNGDGTINYAEFKMLCENHLPN